MHKMPYKDEDRQRKYQRDWRRRDMAKNYKAIKAAKDRKREWIREQKRKPCTDCGKEYPWYVMQFDHVSGVKRFNLSTSSNRGRSYESIQEEIDKCEVVCANCHAERTYRRRIDGEKEFDSL